MKTRSFIVYTIRPLEPNEIYTKQEMQLQSFAEEQDIHILKKYSDIGYPAINPKRPALNEMIRFIKNTEETVDSVIFYAMEHFEKDVKRINYVLPIIEIYVKEVLFLEDYTVRISGNRKEMNSARKIRKLGIRQAFGQMP